MSIQLSNRATPAAETRLVARPCALALAVAIAAASLPATAWSQETSRPRSFNAPADGLQWRKQAPDLPIMISELWGNRDFDGGFGELVRVPPGFNSGRHAHSGDFHGVLIQGEWIHEGPNGEGNNQRLAPGSYIRQAGGQMHVDRCVSTEPCTLFLFQYARADVIWPDEPERGLEERSRP